MMPDHRKIKAVDDERIAEIIRANSAKLGLAVTGTAYFDPELGHLSAYYQADPARRAYFVAPDEDGQVIGGVGIAEFAGIENCAELQKLYLDDRTKGKGCGKETKRPPRSRSGSRRAFFAVQVYFAAALSSASACSSASGRR